jgi:hypothetical protein
MSPINLGVDIIHNRLSNIMSNNIIIFLENLTQTLLQNDNKMLRHVNKIDFSLTLS